MSLFYSSYSDFTDRVREEMAPYRKSSPHISEKLVCCLWMDQLFSSPMVTTSGEPVTVLEPGIWNLEEGPDFLGAILSFGDQKPVKGNVEIHLFSKDWKRHGHHRNKNFQNTLLHAFLWDDSKKNLEKEQGIKQCHLSPFLPEKIEHIASAIDVTRYPFNTDKIVGQCNGRASRAGLNRVKEVLGQAGDERVRKKSILRHPMISNLEILDQNLYQQIMEAAGYRRNREQFKKVATEIPLALLKKWMTDPSREKRATTAKAILFGATGLLPPGNSKEIPEDALDYFPTLQTRWENLSPHIASVDIPWSSYAIRPANTPHRRIAWICEMLADLDPESSLFEQFLPLFLKYDKTKRWNSFFQGLQELCNQTDTFWSYHYSFHGTRFDSPAKLLGDARLKTIIVNVLLPAFLNYANKNSDTHLEEKIHHIYTAAPSAEPNTITRLMEHRLSGCPITKKNARVEQGLIQVFEDFCVSNPEGCKGCRFPELL